MRKQQRGIYYVEFYSGEKREGETLETRNEKEALKKYYKFCDDLENGLIPESGKKTIKQLVDEKLEEYKDTKSVDHNRVCKRVFGYIMNYFGEDKFIDSFERSDIVKFRRHRMDLGDLGISQNLKPLSNRTINNDLQVIRTFFKGIRRDRYIKNNPCEFVDKLKYDPKLRDAFTEEELKLIFNNVPEIYKVFYLFLFHTGCRKAEAVELKLKDIDFVNKVISIRRENTKTKIPRTLPMKPEQEKILKSIPRKSEFVFLNKFGRQHQNISYIFNIFKNKLGMRKEVTLHSFRHTTATYLLRNGASITHVSLLLGHTDIKTTQKIYGHLMVDDIEKMTTDFGKQIDEILNAKEENAEKMAV